MVLRRRHLRLPPSLGTIVLLVWVFHTTPILALSGVPLEGSIEQIRAIGGPSADVYGEMTAVGFQTLCAVVVQDDDNVFLDLGSGHGALVLQAARDVRFRRGMGIELNAQRHARATEAWRAAPPPVQSKATLVQGDAAGTVAARDLLPHATLVWCSNLLFNADLLDRLAVLLGGDTAQRVHTVVCLKEFPHGIVGFDLQERPLTLEMSWTAGKEQPGHPPMPGHPCCVYARRPT